MRSRCSKEFAGKEFDPTPPIRVPADPLASIAPADSKRGKLLFIIGEGDGSGDEIGEGTGGPPGEEALRVSPKGLNV
jgi:hypothetical protein